MEQDHKTRIPEAECREERLTDSCWAENEGQFKALIEAMPEPACFKDGAGRWQVANQVLLREFGMETVDFLGKTDSQLAELAGPFREILLGCSQLDEMAWESGTGHKVEREFVLSNGRMMVLETTKIPLYYSDGRRRGIVGINRNITQQRMAEANDALLRDMDRHVLEGLNLDVIMKKSCERLVHINRCPFVWIGMKEPGGRVSLRSSSGRAEAFIRPVGARWDDSPEGQGAVGRAIRTGVPVVMQTESQDYGPWLEGVEEYGIRSALALPLADQGKIIGALTLYSEYPDFFHKDLIFQLENFAGRLAIAIHSNSNRQMIHLQTMALNVAANPIVITDREGTIQWVNPAFTRHTGYTEREALGQNPRLLKSDKHGQEFYQNMWDTILSGQFWQGEVYNKRKDGSHFHEEMIISPVMGIQGEITHFIAIKQDISERIRLQEELRAMSMMDELTGLYNRRGFFSMANQQLEIANRSMREMLLIFADLDELKGINDKLGHKQGDEALIGMAQVLKETFRRSDIIGRLGGDEFVILVTEAVGDESEQRIYERLQENVALYNAAQPRLFNLSVSTGIVRYDPHNPGKLEELITLADSLMYVRKRQGR